MVQRGYLPSQQLNPQVGEPSQNQQVVPQFLQQSYSQQPNQQAISYPQVQGKLPYYQHVTQMQP